MRAKKSNSVSARKSLTDWGRIDALMDADIAEAAAANADAAPVDVDWSVADIVVPPPKKAISIRLDADVLEFLRGEGPGYQRRINAILRSYVEAKRRRA